MGKTPKKEKKEKKAEAEGSDSEGEENQVEVGPYCQPLADGKLAKKLFKVIKKGEPSHWPLSHRCCESRA